jgi:hypothetical protein
VGGTEPGAANLISGNVFAGITLYGNNNLVQGNSIGTDVSGTQPLGNHFGVLVLGDSNTVGGTAAGAGNLIAFNTNDGVLVSGFVDNAILRNAIVANGNLGIELDRDGNHNQEAPVITSAFSGGGTTTIQGTLQSAPNTGFVVELFVNTTCDPSGSCEGEQFLASLTVATDADGLANFTLALALEVLPGDWITATATDPAGNTSEFSPGLQVTGPGALGNSIVLVIAAAESHPEANVQAAPLFQPPGNDSERSPESTGRPANLLIPNREGSDRFFRDLGIDLSGLAAFPGEEE